MWESLALLTDGQVGFPRVLWFSPTFDERSARYKWNILERAVKPKSKKKKKKKKKYVIHWYLALSMLSRNFSRQHCKTFFLIFPRKYALAFHAICLLRRQFAWNANACFLRKKKKKCCQFIICPESGKAKRLNWECLGWANLCVVVALAKARNVPGIKQFICLVQCLSMWASIFVPTNFLFEILNIALQACKSLLGFVLVNLTS